MPLPQRVQYPASIEPLVQFIEDTPPSEIVDRTLAKLRDGVPTGMMLEASALAVTRSSDLPPGHHGGPLHPLAGLYALSNLVRRLDEANEDRFVPVVQHVALSNKHINDPVTGPFQLLEFAPLEFADFGLCDYLAPVYDPADLPLLLVDATLPKRIVAALPRHDVLALTKLAGDQTLLASLFPDMHRARMRISAYPAALAPDWPAWRVERLNPSVRRELDMKRRRLDRTGKQAFELLRDADEITRAFETLRR